MQRTSIKMTTSPNTKVRDVHTTTTAVLPGAVPVLLRIESYGETLVAYDETRALRGEVHAHIGELASVRRFLSIYVQNTRALVVCESAEFRLSFVIIDISTMVPMGPVTDCSHNVIRNAKIVSDYIITHGENQAGQLQAAVSARKHTFCAHKIRKSEDEEHLRYIPNIPCSRKCPDVGFTAAENGEVIGFYAMSHGDEGPMSLFWDNMPFCMSPVSRSLPIPGVEQDKERVILVCAQGNRILVLIQEIRKHDYAKVYALVYSHDGVLAHPPTMVRRATTVCRYPLIHYSVQVPGVLLLYDGNKSEWLDMFSTPSDEKSREFDGSYKCDHPRWNEIVASDGEHRYLVVSWEKSQGGTSIVVVRPDGTVRNSVPVPLDGPQALGRQMHATGTHVFLCGAQWEPVTVVDIQQNPDEPSIL